MAKIKTAIKEGSKAAATIPASRLTTTRRTKIRDLVAEQFPGADVSFCARGNPNDSKYTPVSDARYFAVYIRNGAVLLRGSTIEGLNELATILR